MSARVAVLTGGASLIGVAFAERWVASGGRIVLADRNDDVSAEVREAIGDAGRFLVGDVTDDAHLSELITTAVDVFGGIDAVVSGPAVFDDDGYATSRERWHRVYNVSKAGLLMLARTGAQALAPRGIRVNSVSPGWTWSRNIERRYGSRERADEFAAEFQPLGRMADPDEIAAAVMFVASEDAAFMTGADLVVDGGYTALGPEALGQAAAKVPPLA